MPSNETPIDKLLALREDQTEAYIFKMGDFALALRHVMDAELNEEGEIERSNAPESQGEPISIYSCQRLGLLGKTLAAGARPLQELIFIVQGLPEGSWQEPKEAPTLVAVMESLPFPTPDATGVSRKFIPHPILKGHARNMTRIMLGHFGLQPLSPNVADVAAELEARDGDIAPDIVRPAYLRGLEVE